MAASERRTPVLELSAKRRAKELYKRHTLVGEKYRLLRRLGRGGMGTVWAARNEHLEVDVAIKLVLNAEKNDLIRVDGDQRLLQEARLCARLMDPAIVRVFDLGRTSENDPFIVMELLEGRDLASRILEERFTPREAAALVLPVVRGLEAAHRNGVLHRDLKPENIFLHEAGGHLQPKLVDFGVATSLFGERRLTRTGEVVGSPAYMSPEQARGEDVDERTDTWGLCVVLYEMVSANLPFHGVNYHAMLHAIIAAEPTALRGLGPEATGFIGIIKRGLEKRPEDRWQTMASLGRALAAWLAEQGVDRDVTHASLDLHLAPRESRLSLSSELSEGRNSSGVASTFIRRASPERRALRLLTLCAALLCVAALAVLLWQLGNSDETVAEAPLHEGRPPSPIVTESSPVVREESSPVVREGEEPGQEVSVTREEETEATSGERKAAAELEGERGEGEERTGEQEPERERAPVPVRAPSAGTMKPGTGAKRVGAAGVVKSQPVTDGGAARKTPDKSGGLAPGELKNPFE